MSEQATIEEQFAVYQTILEPILREKLELGRKYCSPIPRGDHYETSASFNVYEYNGMLWYKDFGHTAQSGHMVHHLLMDLYNISEKEAKERLAKMDLPGAVQVYRKSRSVLEMFDRPELNREELAWWAEYNVSPKTLKKYKVYGVDKLLVHGEKGTKEIFNKENGILSFSYRGGKDLEEWQWYQPDQDGAKKNFFRNGNFIYGWDQLPFKGGDLTTLSGMKDLMPFYEACGEAAMAGSGEGAWRQIKALMPQLKRRFKRFWSLMDPDFPGIQATGKFIEELDINPLPFKYLDQKRDIAQLSRDKGLEWLSYRLYNSFNQI